MRYLNPEERKDSKEVREYLSEFVSQSIKHNFPLQTLQKYRPEKSTRILDAGTASGAFLKQLSEAGYENLYGLDLDNYITSGVVLKEFQKADLNTGILPFSDNSFDAITAWCVIAHLENPHHFIREARRILKRGGVLILTLPNIESNSEKLNFYKKGEFIAYKPNNDHITIWTPSILKKTTSLYFDLIGEEYLVKNKHFRGIQGLVRKWLLGKNRNLPHKWGSKVAYLLKKK